MCSQAHRVSLFDYLSRSLQRFLVISSRTKQIMSEDLFCHDIGAFPPSRQPSSGSLKSPGAVRH